MPWAARRSAVATGKYDREALREAGADHVLDTLEEELPLS